MPYTVWCNDQLVGESELNYVANTDQLKFGDFVATEFGERIIPILMAPRQAICARASMDEVQRLFHKREAITLELRAPDGRLLPTEYIEITDLEWLMTLGGDGDDDWQSDLALAESELLEELRPDDADDGEQLDVLPPDWLDAEDEPPFDEFDVPDLEIEDPTAPPREFPRYQIQVSIAGRG